MLLGEETARAAARWRHRRHDGIVVPPSLPRTRRSGCRRVDVAPTRRCVARSSGRRHRHSHRASVIDRVGIASRARLADGRTHPRRHPPQPAVARSNWLPLAFWMRRSVARRPTTMNRSWKRPARTQYRFEASGSEHARSHHALRVQPRRPIPATVSRSSTSSAQEASMRERLKSSSSRPVTTWYWPPATVTGYEVMMPSGAP